MILIYLICHIWAGSNLVKADDNQWEHIRVKGQRVKVQSIWGWKVKEWEFKHIRVQGQRVRVQTLVDL